MSNGRYILDEDDKVILDDLKRKLEIGIKLLEDRGVRKANIEIELLHHIKDCLKEKVDY